MFEGDDEAANFKGKVLLFHLAQTGETARPAHLWFSEYTLPGSGWERPALLFLST